jgi:hypothetical protein
MVGGGKKLLFYFIAEIGEPSYKYEVWFKIVLDTADSG